MTGAFAGATLSFFSSLQVRLRMGLPVCIVFAGDDHGEKRPQIKHLKYTLLIFLQSRYGKPQFEASHASSK
jgi:hypothetical protein